jgi:exoribonuclease R
MFYTEQDELRDRESAEQNRAREIMEDFMIAANGVAARYLAAKEFPSLRRVVRTPASRTHIDRWFGFGLNAGMALQLAPITIQ